MKIYSGINKPTMKGGHSHRNGWAFYERLNKWVNLRKIPCYFLAEENIDIELFVEKKILRTKQL